jgi:hypothetical protein
MNFLADKKLKTRKNRYDRSLILLLLLPSLSPSFHFSLFFVLPLVALSSYFVMSSMFGENDSS